MPAGLSSDAGGLQFRSQRLDPASLAPGFVAEWQALAAVAIDGNCFLAPWFVLPALRLLGPRKGASLLVVEAFRGPERVGLAALACLHPGRATRSLPWAHWVAYRPSHAYSSGALLDPRWPVAALGALLRDLPALCSGAGALRLSNLRCDGLLATAARGLLAAGPARWYPTRRAARAAWRRRAGAPMPSRQATATLPLAEVPDMPARIRRALRQLRSAAGPVELRVARGPSIDAAILERHLALEHAGWKGSSGCSLLSDPRLAGFFREIVRGALDCDQAFFCELLAGGSVVASTSNFVGAAQGFAFKLGWDPRFARCSPGLLVDHALAAHAASLLPDLDLIDGCADPGSHLDGIWNDRIEVADGYLAWGGRERATLAAFATARRWRERARRLLRRAAPAA